MAGAESGVKEQRPLLRSSTETATVTLMFRFTSGWILLLCSCWLSACSDSDEYQRPSLPYQRIAAIPTIQQGCQKWAALGIDSYYWIIDETYWAPSHIIEVWKGKATRASEAYYSPTFLPSTPLEEGYIGTIEELCSSAASQLKMASDGAYVFADPNYGFPQTFYIDWDSNAADEETELSAGIIAIGNNLENGASASEPCTQSTIRNLEGTWTLSNVENLSALHSFTRSTKLQFYGMQITGTDPSWPTSLTAEVELDSENRIPFCGISWYPAIEDVDGTWTYEFSNIAYSHWLLTTHAESLTISDLGTFSGLRPVPLGAFFARAIVE